MKFFILLAAVGLSSFVSAQEAAPSPTESIGCEPHGDHWHCEGPRPTEAPEPTTEELAPSPTESMGCEPHGDHWHCEGPRPTEAPEETTTAAPEPTEAPEETTAEIPEPTTEELAPSPTESIGCEPHGDHWHCEAPRPTEAPEETTAEAPEPTTDDLAPSPTESTGCEPHGDHWHCDGPATPSSGFSSVMTTTPAPSGNGTLPTNVPEGAAAGLTGAGMGAVAAAAGMAVILGF